MKKVAVVGGGIAGLTAARELSARGRLVTVLDANPWLGGRLRTVDHGGDAIDVGASFFMDFYAHTLSLARSVGLESELVSFPLDSGVLRSGEMRALSPAKELLTGRLLSYPGLARLGAGFLRLLPKWASLQPGDLQSAVADDNETVKSWSRRVLGPEATEFVIEPLLRGVLHWDAETTSRAVLLAMLKAAIKYRGATHLRGGMVSLCEGLSGSFDVRTGALVTSVKPDGSGWAVEYVSNEIAESISVDEVVCAVPANRVAELVPGLDADERAFFGGISYSSTALAVVEIASQEAAWDKSMLFTAQDEPAIAAITPYSVKGIRRPYKIVRIALSSPAYRAKADLPDGELGEFILAAACRISGIPASLRDGRVVALVRWPEALPVFEVGHLRRIDAWRAQVREGSSLVYAGDYLSGPYVEGAVRSGLDAAAQLVAGSPR